MDVLAKIAFVVLRLCLLTASILMRLYPKTLFNRLVRQSYFAPLGIAVMVAFLLLSGIAYQMVYAAWTWFLRSAFLVMLRHYLYRMICLIINLDN